MTATLPSSAAKREAPAQPQTAPERFRRSAYLLLLFSGDQVILEMTDTGERVVVNPKLIPILSSLTSWTTPADWAGSTLPLGQEELDSLADLGILERESRQHQAPDGLWDPVSLAAQRRTGGGIRTPRTIAGPPLRSTARGGVPTALPPPAALNAHLGEVLQRRRTSRDFTRAPLSLELLSTLLAHSARSVPGDGGARRPFPTAGGRCELELQVVAARVEGLAPGVYGYDAVEHAVRLTEWADDRMDRRLDGVAAEMGRPESGCRPAVLIVVTASFEHMLVRYGELAPSLVHKDVGCLFQTLYLVATALDLRACALGRGDDLEINRWLGLDPLREAHVGSFAVGG